MGKEQHVVLRGSTNQWAFIRIGGIEYWLIDELGKRYFPGTQINLEIFVTLYL